MRTRFARIIRQWRMPPGLLYRKVKRHLSVAARRRFERWGGRLQATFHRRVPDGLLASYFHCFEKTSSVGISQQQAIVTNLHMEHRFDLLGTGWVRVGYGRQCQGFGGYRYVSARFPEPDSEGEWLSARINKANLGESKRIWRLVDVAYEPIDWQLDFKSGYRWKDSTWYLDIVIPSYCPGADIKVPWELARCQHLPQLALAYAVGNHGHIENKDRYLREFRNQILDFLANNPPRYGVNWRCTMDVAIRATNWLLAYDLFIAAGGQFDKDFKELFCRSAREHAIHIVGNLEWSESGRSNHYLSNVVGLLALAVYLPRNIETVAWAGWSLREFVLEVEGQFDADGCNREGSTSYHRLSAEMAIYGTALACRLLRREPGVVTAGMRGVPGLFGWGGRPRAVLDRIERELAEGDLPAWFWHRLQGMGKFIVAISKPNRCVPQIGDNDSGRFVKIHSVIDRRTVASAREHYANLDGFRELPDSASYPTELVLNHQHLVDALTAFFDDDEFLTSGSGYRLETKILTNIAGSGPRKLTDDTNPCRIGQTGDFSRYIAAFDNAPTTCRQSYEFVLPDGLTVRRLSAIGFEEFGLFVLRGEGLYAAFRCGPREQYGQGSHLHHDQLSLELVVQGVDLVLDPGSYVYTPLPEKRNAYRGLRAHFAPWPASEMCDSVSDELFVFRNIYRAECLYFQEDGMVGRHFGFAGATYRMVNVERNLLVVRDFSESIPLQRCSFEGQPPLFVGLPFSDRYGGLLR